MKNQSLFPDRKSRANVTALLSVLNPANPTHRTKVLATVCCLAAAIGISATTAAKPEPNHEKEIKVVADIPPATARPKVEVVFVLDSTGSMGGLIEGAKQKIWSIANSMVEQKPAPEVRIGLLPYRDRGDEYVTKIFDLTDDIDTVYKNLQSVRADGGGDTPESVNQALSEAVNRISWSADKQTTKIIFLVGDCPPHMDYQDDVKYPETCRLAAQKGIIINTIQCGNFPATVAIWQEISRQAEGSYVALEQSGGMVAMATPVDAEIAKVSAEIATTSVAYGDKAQQAAVADKQKIAAEAKSSVAAARAVYNSSTGGKAIQGRGDLVADVAQGLVKVDTLKETELPPEMQKMKAEERASYVAKQQEKRAALNNKMESLARQRAEYIEEEKKRLQKEGKGDSFDLKVSEIVAAQVKKNTTPDEKLTKK